jgi:FkbM family methyltransferase
MNYKYVTNNNYNDLVHIVDKSKVTYYDDGIFKEGISFENYGLSTIMAQKAERVSDAMILCWNLDHKPKFEEYCDNKRVAVQAGGFIGIYPQLLSQMFNEVYTFEPDPLNFHCLVNNCQTKNIHKFNGVLGDVNKLISIGGGLEVNPGMFRVVESVDNLATIPQFRIDDLKLNQCDLIQLDIEGRELFALAGAEETISEFKPVICCEVHLSSQVSEMILKYLSKWNYKEVESLDYAGDKLYKVI